MKTCNLQTLEAGSLRPLLETEFRLQATGESGVSARLVELTEFAGDRRVGPSGVTNRTPFSAVFLCDAPRVPQGSYTVEHPEIRLETVFLCPVGIDNGKCRIEAIFN